MANGPTQLTIEYRLPVTVIRFSGDIVTVTDVLKPMAGPTRQIVANAVLDIRGDPRSTPTFSVAEEDLGELSLDLTLLPDGRLAGSEAQFDDQSGARLSAALNAGVNTTGALMSILSGAGAPGVATAVAAGAAVALGGLAKSTLSVMGPSTAVRVSDEPPSEDTGDIDPVRFDQAAADLKRVLDLSDPRTRDRPSAEDVGIEPRFKRDQPASHKVLHGYRVALLYLAQAHADQAERAAEDPVAGANALRHLDRALRSTREEASRVEEIYRVWRSGFLNRVSSHIDRQFFVDELPSTAAFLDQVRDRSPRDEAPEWWEVASTLRVMLTCDLEVTGAPASAPRGGADDFSDGTILHRVPMQARLGTWRLRKNASDGSWYADLEKTEWILAAHPSGTRATRLPVKGKDRQLALKFDDSGALTSVEASIKGAGVQRTDTLSGVSNLLAGAATTTTAIGAALGPAARAAALKGQVDELEQRAKLQGLLNPSPDSLADLRKQLAQAEVEAQLALARRVITDPSSVLVVANQPDD